MSEVKNEAVLTHGPIFKILMKLATPLVASAFMSTLYTLVDMYWVGRLGAEVIAGVGVAGMYTWLASGLCKFANTGGQVYVARNLGEGKEDEAIMYASADVQLGIAIGVIFGLICLFFTSPLVTFFKMSNPLAVASAIQYIRIVCGLGVATNLGLILTNLYTAQGNSKIPMIANMAGLIFNIVVDPFLIFGCFKLPGLGAIGSALATIIAQIMVILILLFCGRKNNAIFGGISLFKILPAKYYKDILVLSWPVVIQDTVYCGISMLLSRMLSSFGDTALAVMRVGNQLEALSWNVSQGFSTAVNAFVSQNYGARKYDRIHKGYLAASLIVALEGIVITILFVFGRRELAGLFFYEEEGIRIFMSYLVIVGISELFMNVEIMSSGAMAAIGKTRLSSIICVSLTAFRLPMALFFIFLKVGVSSIWWAIAISSILKGLVMFVTFQKLEIHGKVK